jgi:AcrR family transcriptional regulator
VRNIEELGASTEELAASTEELAARPKRADARRNEQALLDAAASVFVTSGVDAPVRDIAAKAGVGMGTIYRHFPKRADLVIAVYRHQVEACAEAGPALLASETSPHVALQKWAALFVDFLVTKHGLAGAIHGDRAIHGDGGNSNDIDALHRYFIDRLVPVCGQILDGAADAGEIDPDLGAYEVMRAIGNLCIGADVDSRYDAHRMVEFLIVGIRVRR